jgi:probable phosphoglycerate mutase
MPLDPTAKYHEQGTALSGYAEGGPYHCEDCIHKPDKKTPLCLHPAVVVDPELQHRLVAIQTGPAIQINLERGCCRYVNPGIVALFLRHGETELNAQNRFRGHLDVPLDQNGLQQAQEAAQFILKEYPGVVRIVCSPLTRARQTAQPIADALGIPVEIDQRLISWHLGMLTGQNRDDFKDVLQQHIDNPTDPIPGGESLDEVRERVGQAVEEILDHAEEHGLTLVVTQSSDIYPILQLIEGKDHGEELETPMTGPGGVIAVSIEGDGFKAEVVFGEEKPAEIGAS